MSAGGLRGGCARRQNSAHDTSQSSKASTAGWEGIYSNLSLMALYSTIELASGGVKKPR